jgi:type I protein arginine methyltransferase
VTRMYDLVSYGRMVADQGRNSSYDRALRANIRPGSVVLDIGAGPGILTFLACRAGAARVYSVEPDDVIELARQLAADNGFSNRIEFIQAMTTEIDLPEKVDGIVADIRGRSPLLRKSIVSILDARDRFLKPEGWIIPARDTMWAAPVSSIELYDKFIGAWNNEYQFNFDRARLKAVNKVDGLQLNARHLVAAPQRWAVLDYRSLDHINVDGEMRWIMDRAASAHGVCTWFDCETAAGTGYSNSPASGERHIYKQLYFPWPEAVELMAGDQVEVRLRADLVDSDYVWSWYTRVMKGERIASEFRQSTFSGVPFAPDRLRKREHRFVPEPNEDYWIDRRVLDLMQQKLSLDEIAKALVAEFPVRFRNWGAALTKAANLSAQYSK